jgi:hypothetical protein
MCIKFWCNLLWSNDVAMANSIISTKEIKVISIFLFWLRNQYWFDSNQNFSNVFVYAVLFYLKMQLFFSYRFSIRFNSHRSPLNLRYLEVVKMHCAIWFNISMGSYVEKTKWQWDKISRQIAVIQSTANFPSSM